MAEGIYQKLLGLPPEVVAPDYYQLLGIEKGPVDPAALPGLIGSILDRLNSAPGASPEVISQLTREIGRARAILTDDRQREDYHRQLLMRRMQDLRVYVERLVEIRGELNPADEKVLLDRLEEFEIGRAPAASLVEQRLTELGASRGSGEPGPEELADAVVRVREVMSRVAEEQLTGGYSGGAPPQEPEHLVVEDGGPPEPQSDPEAVPDSPPPLPEKSVPYTPVPPPPKVPTAVRKRSAEVNMSVLKKRIEQLEAENATLSGSPAARGNRGRRAVAALLAVAAAFGIGDFVSSLYPAAEAGLYKSYTTFQGSTQSFLASSNGMAAILGGAAVLLLLSIFLAGARKRLPFLIPLAPVGLVALVAGMGPLGAETTHRAKVSELEKQMLELQETATRSRIEMDQESERTLEEIRRRDAEIGRLKKEVAARESALGTARATLASRDRTIALHAADITRRTDELAILKTENKVLREERAERDKLKKEIEARDKTIATLERDKRNQAQAILDLQAEIRRLKQR